MSPAESVPWDASTHHGELRRLRYVARFAYGDSLATDCRVDGDIAVMGSNGEVGCHVVANTLGPVVVIGRKGSFGKVTYSERPCFCIDTTYFVDARFTNADLRWLFYALQDLGLDTVSQDTGVPGLSRESAYDSRLLVPSSAMQRAIAAFLDRRSAAIDALIAKKERLIELLQEKRQALITQAVTKGLDPNVPMKDSGIEWLGQIPERWSVRPLKHLLTHLVDCPHSTPEYDEDGEFFVVRTADIEPGRVRISQIRKCSGSTYRERVSRLVPRGGDILYSREGERFGMAALVPPGTPVCLGQRMMQLRPGSEVLPGFLMWALNAKPATEFVKVDTVGATSPRVNIPTIAEIPIAFPSLAVQRETLDWLESHIQRIDGIIDATAASTARLSEYRQALISAAVTGKIEIPAEEAA